MVGNAILKFTIEPDGSLSHRANFALLNLLVPNKTDKWWAGPDSFKLDAAGNLYVAQFFGGRILKLSPQGELLHVFDVGAGNGTCQCCLRPGRAGSLCLCRDQRG